MRPVFDKRENATKHAVVKDDTLTSLANHYKTQGGGIPDDLTPEDLARYNWGTAESAEVKRAIFERIGSSVVIALTDASNYAALAMDPAFGPAGTKEILIPKKWTVPSVELKKTHTVKMQQRKPATAIAIKKLDKWFIPDRETCESEYRTEGLESAADKVDFEVYGSNYCSLNAWNDGLPTFTALAGTPVFSKSLAANLSKARTEGSITDWKGDANCTQGLLAPGNPAGQRRLNVAFSPYTVNYRFCKGTAAVADDKKARIDLKPFWLLFDPGTGQATADSRKVKWEVKESSRLKAGLLTISDKTGTIVFAQGLEEAKLTKDAPQEFQWSGLYSDGVTQASAANMPYRVQIQGHTDIDEAEGVAVAAMHTEVRLFVHPNTNALTLNPYVTSSDEPSLRFTIADYWHKAKDPKRQQDGVLWTKFALAQAGFHPGPVRDATVTNEYQGAVWEFQRSVPKKRTKQNAPYERLALDGIAGDQTNDALETIAAARRRPLFGKTADRTSYTDTFDGTGKVTARFQDDATFQTNLNDRTHRMIVWVDDRNWYSYENLGDATLNDEIYQHLSAVGNNRGTLSEADNRVAHDARDVARPWIPLQVDFALLGKANSLTDVVAFPNDKDVVDLWRQLIGPLRVDWTFDEIETVATVNTTPGGAATNVDLPELDAEVRNTLTGLYHRERTRTKIALRWIMNDLKEEHDRQDVTKRSKYFNCPESCGGIRPDAIATYYQQAFGKEAKSLQPWTAKADGGREAIYTVVHDKLGQPEDSFFVKRQGRAGVYFNPSRIAGDGYQVRAQVRFQGAADYAFPNVDALKDRYPKLPQAHTAQFRLWRKTSLRGYVCWGPTNTWAAVPAPPRPNLPDKGPAGFRRYYTACHLHVENEINKTDGDIDFTPQDLMTESEFRSVVKEILPGGDKRRKNMSWIRLGNRMWPWAQHDQFGVTEASAANLALGDGFDDLKNRFIDTIENSYYVRICAELVRGVEKHEGLFRGHILVEFQATDPVYIQRYVCARCGDKFVYMQANGKSMVGERCPTNGCGNKWISPGKLRAETKYRGSYACAGVPSHNHQGWESGPAGGDYNGQACPDCGAALALQGVPAVVPADPPYQLQYSSGGVPTPGLPTSSMGNPLGVAINFLGDSDLWGHELAHTRYHQHTGNAPSPAIAQHDARNNTTVNWGALVTPEPDPINQCWDRSCLMTYATDLASYDDAKDMVCFCARCVLKARGWKLQDGAHPVNLPPSTVMDQ
ncbi:MAG: hypothetical protein SFV54_19740 [Bryobacteraceae bacterium]|nr:hypothetical protein [Bryobacteraceae bacterium]